LDENFLKMKDRALELLDLMEKNHRHFTFSIFSSTETLKAIGDLDILVRLGVTFIWIGVESKKEIFAKNKGTDFYVLFRELQKRGISVLASLILFLEEHDKKTVWEDVDFVTSLNPDYLQFAPLGPLPGTKLYSDYESQGKVLKEVPYASQHGQGKIWFQHDSFSRDESEDFLRLAFEIDYNRNGASILRAMKTAFNGYIYSKNHPDERIRERSEGFKKRLKLMRYFLTASTVFVQNRKSETLLKEIKKSFRLTFGRMNLPGFIASMIVVFFSIKEYLRYRTMGDVRTPKTSYRRFNESAQYKNRPAESSTDAEASSKVAYRWPEQPAPSLAADNDSHQELPLKRVA